MATAIPQELNKTEFGKMCVSTAIKLNNKTSFSNRELKQAIINLFSNSQIMLFLRNINLITVDKNFSIRRTKVELNKREFSESEKLVLNYVSLKTSHEKTDWIVGDFIGVELDDRTKESLREDDKAPKRLKEAKYTNISFAARINDEGDLIEIKENSFIFTYLPTKINKGFPCLVNADFLTNAPREGFHEDRTWNIWLFEQVGFKYLQWLGELATTEYRYQITNIIADKFKYPNQMEKAFNLGYKKAIETIPFIPNKNNDLLLLSETLIEKTDIDEVIEAQVLVEYYNSVKDTNFSIKSIANKKLKSISNLVELGAKTFEVKNLIDLFDSLELQDSLKVENNFKVVNFFYKKATSEQTASFWKNYIPDIAFIFNQKKKLCSPSKPIYFPADSFEALVNQSFNFVHSQVLEGINLDSDIKDWLSEVGVAKPTPKDIIEKTILPNLQKLTSTDVTSFEIVRYLFANQRHIDDFSKFSQVNLVTTKGSLKKSNLCYLSNAYKPELPVESYLPDEDFFVISEYMLEGQNVKEWNLFLTGIGVSENISYCEFTEKIPLRNLQDFGFRSDLLKRLIIDLYAFTGMSYVSRYTLIEKCSENHKLAKLVWECILQKNDISV